jgi:S1-C subfamily serine protease
MSRETSSRRRVLKIGGIALTVGLAGCNAPLSSSDSDESPTPSQSPEPTRRLSRTDSGYARVYRNAISSVVLVDAGQGQGTGFQYDNRHIVTNAHVVGNASTVQLRYHDGTWSEGEVRGTDRHSDLAVIAATDVPEQATPLPLAETPPAVGQEVVTIGNPYNLDGSVSSGLVSGVDRLIPSPAGYRIPDAIQTDAAVNPGNSGGPLMSLDGAVLGVVNAKRGDNIAFGISAALARRVVPGLVEDGAYDHAYLGVSLANVTPTVAEANGLDEPRGLAVVQTVRASPADDTLRPGTIEYIDGARVPVGGDILLAADERTVRSVEDLASHLALQTKPGETLALTVLRDGNERTVETELVARPERSRSPLS